MRKKLSVLLGVGLVVIVALSGFGLYKMHLFKQQFQASLNEHFPKTLDLFPEVTILSSPFECSGWIYIQCQSQNISLLANGEKLLSFPHPRIALKDIDFKSLTLQAYGDLERVDMGDLEEYAQILFPKHFQLTLKLSPQRENYHVESKLALRAQNLTYENTLSGEASSENIKEEGMLKHFQSLQFLDDGFKVQTLSLSLRSQDLSQELLKIAKKKYDPSLDKASFDALVQIFANIGLESLKNQAYYAQTQPLFEGLISMVLGEHPNMLITLTPKDTSANLENLDDPLQFFTLQVSHPN